MEVAGVVLASVAVIQSAQEIYEKVVKDKSLLNKLQPHQGVEAALLRCVKLSKRLEDVLLNDAKDVISREELAQLEVLSKSSLALSSRLFIESAHLRAIRKLRRADVAILEEFILQVNNLSDHLEIELESLTR